jgi:hypothetical protein
MKQFAAPCVALTANGCASRRRGGEGFQVIELVGAPGEIRTPDLLVRSQTLYPTELQAR